jgi:hypothetical protein
MLSDANNSRVYHKSTALSYKRQQHQHRYYHHHRRCHSSSVSGWNKSTIIIISTITIINATTTVTLTLLLSDWAEQELTLVGFVAFRCLMRQDSPKVRFLLAFRFSVHFGRFLRFYFHFLS